MALILLISEGKFESIEIKFFISGHSYMPSDRDFGIIEKRKENVKCMVPEKLENMVATARIANPCIGNKHLNTSKLQLSVSSEKRREEKGKLQMKTSYFDDD